MGKQETQKNANRKITKIVVKREDCIGAATCIAVAPDAYELDDENIAVVKREWINHTDEEILLSAQACPTLAIYLYDEEGNQLFPEKD